MHIKLNFESQQRKRRLQKELFAEYNNVVKIDCEVSKKWYGNSYGGFFVAPDYINKNSVVYSFGIGKDISFDKKIMKNHGCQVFAYDPTPNSIAYVKTLNNIPLFDFHAIGLADYNGDTEFFLPKIGVSGSLKNHQFLQNKEAVSVEVMTLDSIMQANGHSSIDVLKIDIEGSEYAVLEDILRKELDVKQICVEFHDRFFDEPPKSFEIIEKLRSTGYCIFGVSQGYEEVSFIKL
ncbi:MAG: FkbM family methyltransferase [Weeksellaceae bacterium]|nr:FkbM family methyltransferase [Weeksellaceae bacterium]